MKTSATRSAATATATQQASGNPNPPESADLDVDGGTTGDDEGQPRTVKMPRARHEIVTGPDEDDKIAPGTFITEKVATAHKLDEKMCGRLVASGAIELVDVQQQA